MTFLPTQDKKGRGKSLSPLRKRPSTVAAQGQKDSCGKSRIKPRSPHAPNCIRYSQGKGTFFPAIFYIRSERSETDSGEIRLSTDRRYGIELFGSVSPQGEFFNPNDEDPREYQVQHEGQHRNNQCRTAQAISQRNEDNARPYLAAGKHTDRKGQTFAQLPITIKNIGKVCPGWTATRRSPHGMRSRPTTSWAANRSRKKQLPQSQQSYR